MSIPVSTLSAGELIPRGPWEGRIVSLYSRALNLLHPDGLLVGLVAQREQMSPFSALTPELFSGEGARAPSALLSVNTRCSFSGRFLTIGDLRVNLSNARRWTGALAPELQGKILELDGITTPLRNALMRVGADDGLREVIVSSVTPTIFGTRAREILSRVRVKRNGQARELHGLSPLVGLGIGFTPSGDDFVSGVLLAEGLIGNGKLEVNRDEIRSVLGKTNHGGRTLLTGALVNRYPAYLLDFATRLGEAAEKLQVAPREAAQTVEDAVRLAARHGETSGTDAVTGLTWYLSFCDKTFDEIASGGLE